MRISDAAIRGKKRPKKTKQTKKKKKKKKTKKDKARKTNRKTALFRANNHQEKSILSNYHKSTQNSPNV